MIIAIPLSKEKLLNYDVILLAGGHVPTQNRYFKEIDLKKIKDFQGIVIGIIAGSMNCAHTVYVQPGESGESLDPNFKRRILGLNLTKQNILPHYQMVKVWMVKNYLKKLLILIVSIIVFWF